MLGLTAAAQSLFVTFGAWLEDDFGFGTAALVGLKTRAADRRRSAWCLMGSIERWP